MKLLECSHVDISFLKGALIISPNKASYIITGVSVSLEDFTPWLHLKDPDENGFGGTAIAFDDKLKDWSIQIGNDLYE